jgi:hypothetical protein
MSCFLKYCQFGFANLQSLSLALHTSHLYDFVETKERDWLHRTVGTASNLRTLELEHFEAPLAFWQQLERSCPLLHSLKTGAESRLSSLPLPAMIPRQVQYHTHNTVKRITAFEYNGRDILTCVTLARILASYVAFLRSNRHSPFATSINTVLPFMMLLLMTTERTVTPSFFNSQVMRRHYDLILTNSRKKRKINIK